MMPCPRCLQRGETYVAGNRIARPCPSCEGKGFISEPMATQDDADREIEALRKRVAELEAENAHLRDNRRCRTEGRYKRRCEFSAGHEGAHFESKHGYFFVVEAS